MTAVVLVLVVSLPALVVLALRPVPRRLALRYPVRRPVEALLVVLGCMLGTSIITGSLIVGDTIDRSIRASAYDQLGPIDEIITVSGLEQGEEVATRFDGFTDPSVDGVLALATIPAAVQGGATQPRAQLVELDFAEAAAFGDDPAITGIDGPTPAPGHAVITADLAERAQVGVGEQLVTFAYGQLLSLEVDSIVDRTGLAGFWPIDGRQQSYNVLVAPGTLADLVNGVPDASTAAAEPPSAHVAFSNVGGVESGVPRTDEALEGINAVDAGTENVARPVKRDLLDDAEAAAEGLTQLYFTMGMFAVAAGVLLLVNIFVMLAEDRRGELGMLRALGLRRLPLVGAFTTEGWLYSLVAGVIGSLIGIGLGWVIAWRASQILTTNTDQNSLKLTFSFDWSTVATGFAIGLVISLLTIMATSARVSRMNVIAAIRDLPTVTVRYVRRRYRWLGLLGVIVGVAWAVIAGINTEGYGVAIGPMIAIVGLGPLLAPLLGTRAAITIVAVAELVWGTAFIPVLGALDIEIEVPVFLVQGLAMAAAAVALITAYQGEVGRWVARRSGGALSVRLGLAYPIARRFRTAMTLGMFAIVILTLVYLSIISFMFRNQVDDISADLAGGFGVVVTSNPTNPLTVEQLQSLPEAGAVAPLVYGFADFEVGDADPQTWPVTGFGPELVAAPPVLQDRGSFDTEAEAWAAVADDPQMIIVDEFFLSSAGGPPTGTPKPGESLTMRDPLTGNMRIVTVAAWAEADFLFNGVFYGTPGLVDLTDGRGVPSRFFVEPLGDDTALAGTIRTTFLENGADAEAISDTIDSALAQQSGFFALMQQFVGVGLIVGIAGIGVIMVRAVRERRRVIGVLRSIGFQPRDVSRAFLIEAAFVTIEGVAIGVLVGLIGTYGLVLSNSGFVEGLDWGVPWNEVALIVAIALVASAIAAILPARRASKIKPAEALRVTD